MVDLLHPEPVSTTRSGPVQAGPFPTDHWDAAAKRAGTLDSERAARGAIFTLVGTVVGAVANFAMLAVVARVYGAVAFGLFSGISALFLAVTMVTRLGADMGATWYVSRLVSLGRRDQVASVLRAALGPVLAVSGLVAAAMIVAARPLAGLLSEEGQLPAFAAMLRVVALAVPLAAAGEVLLGASRGYGAMRPTIIASQLGRQVGQLVTVALAATLSRDPRLLALAWAFPYLGTVVYPAIWLRRATHHGREVAPIDRRSFWRYAGPQGANQTAQIGLEKLDIILLGPLAGLAAQGAYNAANRLAHLVVLAWYALMLAYGPVWAGLFEQRRDRDVNRSARMVTVWGVLLVGPILWSFILYGRVWTGALGHELKPGGSSLAILGAALLVSLLLGPCENLLLMAGRSSWSFLNNLVALGVNVGLNLALIPRLGAAGAALAWLIALFVVRGLAAAMVYRERRVATLSRPVIEAWLLVAAVFGGVGALFRLLLGVSLAGLAATAVGGGLVHLVAVHYQRDRFAVGALIASLRARGTPRETLPQRADRPTPVTPPFATRRHLQLRLRSRVAAALPLNDGAARLMIDTIPVAGWRGQTVRRLLGILARTSPALLPRLPLFSTHDQLPSPFDPSTLDLIVSHAADRLAAPVDGIVWLLPPSADDARVGALLLHSGRPVGHLRVRRATPPIGRPRPAWSNGHRTGTEWPLIMDRWIEEGVSCELSSPVTAGRHWPARPDLATLLDLVDDIRDALTEPEEIATRMAPDDAVPSPSTGALEPMHGDLVPWNLRSTADGHLVLFDWEHVGYGPPDTDLVRYLAHSPGGLRQFAALPAARRSGAVPAIALLTALAEGQDGKATDNRWKQRDRRRELQRLRHLARLAAAAGNNAATDAAPAAEGTAAASGATTDSTAASESAAAGRAQRPTSTPSSRRGGPPRQPRPGAGGAFGHQPGPGLLEAGARRPWLALVGALVGLALGWVGFLPAGSRSVAAADLVLTDPWGADPAVVAEPVGGDFQRFVRAQRLFLISPAVLDSAAEDLGVDGQTMRNRVAASTDETGTLLHVTITAPTASAADATLDAVLSAYRAARHAAVTAIRNTEYAAAAAVIAAEQAASPARAPAGVAERTLPIAIGERNSLAADYGDGVSAEHRQAAHPALSPTAHLLTALATAGTGLVAGLIVAWWAARRPVVSAADGGLSHRVGPGDGGSPTLLGALRPKPATKGRQPATVPADHLAVLDALVGLVAPHPLRVGQTARAVVVTSVEGGPPAAPLAAELARAGAAQGVSVAVVPANPQDAGWPNGLIDALVTAPEQLVLVPCPAPTLSGAAVRLSEIVDAVVVVAANGSRADRLAGTLDLFARVETAPLGVVVVER